MGKILLNNVTKTYDMVNSTSERLKLLFSSNQNDKFVALNGVSLTIFPGEVVGLLGINGSGKSTLSNIISGIIYPDYGTVSVDGEVAIIAVSQGLKKVLTGRENIKLKCLMLGMTESEIEKKIPDIIEFADIGQFIDQPIKKYSSGMKSRLGFAIAVNVNADILVIDEALSVGDQTFYNKCIDKMNVFKSEGKTIVFVSHNLSQVSSFCDRAIWLESGKLKMDGQVKEVIKEYKAFLNNFKNMSEDEKRKIKQRNTIESSDFDSVTQVHLKTNENKENFLNYFTISCILASIVISGINLF